MQPSHESRPDPTHPAEPTLDIHAAVQRAARGIGKLTRMIPVRTELTRLPSVLMEGEIPDAVVSGIQGLGWGLLVATNRRLMWVDKGLVTFRVEEIRSDSISAVNAKTGIVGGEVEVRYYESWRIINFIPNADVHRIANAIMARVEEAKSNPTEAPSTAPQ